MCKISVIVPVYNAEKYLRRCVENILNQTFTDFELILVDDGSTDRSAEMCDQIKKMYDCIKVIHKKNGGAATARNAGLDIAKGQYISFFDSDDWAHPQMLEMLYDLADKTNAGLTCCGYEKATDYFIRDAFDIDKVVDDAELVSADEVLDHFYDVYLYKIWLAPWAKLYKRSVFDHLRFKEGVICEDAILFIPSIEAAKTVAIADVAMYYYYLSDNSVMRSKFSEKNFIGLEIINDRCNYFRNNKKQYRLTYMDYYELYIAFAINSKKYFKEYKNYFRRYEKKMLYRDFIKSFANSECCNMFRLALLMSFLNVEITERICKKYFPHVIRRL